MPLFATYLDKPQTLGKDYWAATRLQTKFIEFTAILVATHHILVCLYYNGTGTKWNLCEIVAKSERNRANDYV